MALPKPKIPAQTGDFNPEDWNYFRQSRRRIDDAYMLALPQNQWEARSQANQFQRAKGDMAEQFARQRVQLPQQFAGRGLLNSGIYQDALSKFGANRSRATANLRQQYEEQRFGTDLARQQLEQTRGNALEDIEWQEAARRAAIAATIRASKGY